MLRRHHDFTADDFLDKATCVRSAGIPACFRNQSMTSQLTEGSILIRPFRAGDEDVLYEAVRESIPEVSVWLPWCHKDYSIDESRDFITTREMASQGGEWYSFGIFERDSGRFLGGVGINFVNRVHRLANLGYWVRTSAAGQGVATTATRLAAKFGFEEVGLQRIEIVAAVENIASQRVAEKAGAKREGILRRRLWFRGQSLDAVLFSLVPEDLNSMSARSHE